MAAALRTMRILWAGILSSSLLFFVLVFVLAPDEPPPGLAFAAVLGAVAATMALASVVVPRAIFRSALRRVRVVTREVVDRTNVPGLAKQRVAAEPEALVEAALQHYGAPFVIGLALSEAVGLFGFVLGFLGFPVGVVVPFFLLSWGLIAWRYPTERAILGPAQAVLGVRLGAAARAP